jgi:DUF2971 family protein
MDTREAAARMRVEIVSARAWLDRPAPTKARPQRLFHYTSQAGLLGIVSSNVLWATNALYLSDSSELDYGLTVAREKLRSVFNGSNAVSELLSRTDQLLKLPILVPDRNFYACCFCEDSDLLSQWRAYADRGGGYAIGFEVDDLTRAGLKPNLSLFPVEYGDCGPNAELLTHDINVVCEALDRCLRQWPGDRDRLVSAASEDMKLAIIFRVLGLKHPGFREEREWRILANFDSSDFSFVHFRQGQTSLIPYVELSLPCSDCTGGRLPIREVVYGPTAHSELASRSIVSLFKKFGFDPPSIWGSTIPFRTI